MVRKILVSLSLLCAVLAFRPTYGQSTFSVPNGGFENWTSHPGYGVTVLFFQLPVFSDFSSPTDWNYMSYPVNKTLSYSGLSFNVNTDVPLLKVSQETSGAAQGNSSLALHTFMLSDIINSTVYSLAESSIDSSLTSMVVPTVLTTGAFDLDHFLPIMDDVLANMGSLSQLLAAFGDEDVNYYVDGGIALNGFTPDRLQGRYKYTSATSGDNGGIFLLGTKFNPTTHRREIVGGGYNVDLTDNSSYTPFQVDYMSLHEIDSTYAEIEPDSLVIMLVSSANNHRQHGSILYLDALQLSQGEIVEPDTCQTPYNFTVLAVDTTTAHVSWLPSTSEIDGTWEFEYGIQGFGHGTGVTLTPNVNEVNLTGLQPGTTYDCYVRLLCGEDLYGDWAMLTFQTDTVPAATVDSTGICDFAAMGAVVYPNPAQGAFQVTFTQEIPSSIMLYTMEGKLVQSIRPNQPQVWVELPRSGMYILKCETTKGAFVQKIISR